MRAPRGVARRGWHKSRVHGSSNYQGQSIGWKARTLRTLAKIDAFVGADHAEEADFDRYLATVLFTDMVKVHRARGGDWGTAIGEDSEISRRHHAAVRSMLTRYNGAGRSTPQAMGSSRASTGPRGPFDVLQHIAELVRPLGLRARAGVHTGEVQDVDGKVGGLAVWMGATGGGDGRAVGDPRLRSTIQGTGFRLRSRLRGCGRARAERCPRSLAPLPSGGLKWRSPRSATPRRSTASTSHTRSSVKARSTSCSLGGSRTSSTSGDGRARRHSSASSPLTRD